MILDFSEYEKMAKHKNTKEYHRCGQKDIRKTKRAIKSKGQNWMNIDQITSGREFKKSSKHTLT